MLYENIENDNICMNLWPHI